jgi:hypothetical protein
MKTTKSTQSEPSAPAVEPATKPVKVLFGDKNEASIQVPSNLSSSEMRKHIKRQFPTVTNAVLEPDADKPYALIGDLPFVAAGVETT